MDKLRPGIQTTEAWFTMGTAVIMLLVLAGVIKPADEAAANGVWQSLVSHAMALGGLVGVVVTYVSSRMALKMQAMSVGATVPAPTVANGRTQVREVEPA